MSVLPRTAPRRLLAVALALTTVVTAGGCGAFDMPEAQPCAWLDGTSDGAGDTARRTVVLVDRSASARPAGTTAPGARIPDWAATLLTAPGLALPQLEGQQVSVAAFDGTRATVDWDVNQAPVTPVKGSGTLKKDRRGVRRGCLQKRLQQLSATAPGAARTDVLGALAAAAEQLGRGRNRGRIVMATDGLANTGCADLRSAGFDGSAEVGERVRQCRAAGELPDLKGAEVNLVGIGRQAHGAAPSSPQTAWLVSLWTRLCEASGATECEVAATARSRRAGRNTVAGKPEPEVAFPAVTERPAGKVTTLTLPGSVLFATDRSQLTSAARSTLDDAADRIRKLGPLSVTVSGHTDSRGSEESGRRLSRARAYAVRSALVRRGIPVATARGYSDDRPRCTPEYRNGAPDHAAMACNRRVEIAVTVRR